MAALSLSRAHPLFQLQRKQVAFFVALMLVAANLRPSLTSVGPVLKSIQLQLSLSATTAGLLNSLPLLMFAAAAPLARFSGRFGAERLMLWALLALASGIVLRSGGEVVTLFGGTLLLASGIAVANILMPQLIKQRYPDRIPAITTAYATVMAGFAGIASGVAVPLERLLPGGWQGSLASWSLLCVLALAFWLPHVRSTLLPSAAATTVARAPPWRETLGWQVTAFMGLQATSFYTTITWYPAILAEAGHSRETAGVMLTLFQFVGLIAGLGIPVLIRRFSDQRGLAVAASLFVTVGNLGMLFVPQAGWLWMVVLGIGSGPCLILALSFMGLRARDAATAAALSLMAQSMGYLIAAFGPVAFGFVHDATGGWSAALCGLAALGVVQALSGLGAGRKRTI